LIPGLTSGRGGVWERCDGGRRRRSRELGGAALGQRRRGAGRVVAVVGVPGCPSALLIGGRGGEVGGCDALKIYLIKSCARVIRKNGSTSKP
jgi:hypothetical protein